MTKYATMNPLGSTSPYDLFDNAQNFDTAINSITAAIWLDRLGKGRHTWYGLEKMAKAAIAAFGYITMDSFQAGATLTLPNQVLRDTSTGEYYRWDGSFLPSGKVVPAGSTPASSGGISIGAWLSVGDAVLRSQISDPDSAALYPELHIARWRDELDVRGWKVIGDGIIDDTLAFAAFEAEVSGREVDLGGRSYAVTSAPTGNRYFNGEWLLPTGSSRTRWQGAQHTGAGRIAFGDDALAALPDDYSMGSGATVIAQGYRALASATQVKKTMAFGPNAMENTRISRDNIAMGDSALKNIQSRTPDYSQTQMQGTRMICIGGNTGYFAVDAYNMLIAGRNAGHCVVGGTGLVALGAGAVSGYAVVGLSGEIENCAPWGVDGQIIRTVGVGLNTLGSNLALANVGLGGDALYNNKKSNNNTGLGVRALFALDIDTGHNGGANVEKDIAGTYFHSGNTLTLNFTNHGAVVGDKVQIRLLDGGSQTFQGDQVIATVSSVLSANSFTVAHPLSRMTSGAAHLYGLETAAQQTRNEWNLAAGTSAGTNLRTGAFNTLLGPQAAQTATSATRATLAGYQVANLATSISNSALVGTFCATMMTSLQNVTAIGDSSLRFKIDGTDLTEAWTNITGIGYAAAVSGPNQLQLGNSNANVYSQSAIQVRSDERDKADKREIDGDLAVAFVRGLKSYFYKYDFRDDYFDTRQVQTGIDDEAQPVFELRRTPLPKDGSKKRERDHAGYLAQQTKALMDELGIDFGMYQDHLVNGGCDVKTLAYEQAIPFITKALDVAFSRLDEIEERLAKLESQ